MPVLTLHGCPPEPLGNYLKALGVFRLVAEQADPQARAWWKEGSLCLHSNFGSESQLVAWFKNRYRPSPHPSPWFPHSGWWPPKGEAKGDKRGGPYSARLRLVCSRLPRFRLFRQSAAEFQKFFPREQNGRLSEPALTKMEKGAKKQAARARLLCSFRNQSRLKEALLWFDAAAVLGVEADGAPAYFPILGDGALEGVNSFAGNYYKYLSELLPIARPSDFWNGEAGNLSLARLRAALLGAASIGQQADDAAGGFYFPNLMEAPNVGQKFVAEPKKRANPWDFVLAMEGVLFWSVAAVRRLELHGHTRASFPFFCEAAAGGNVSLGPTELAGGANAKTRGELWLPIWESPATCKEIERLLVEGRISVGGRTAARATEFALGVASLGHERGIATFVRTGLLQRSGSGDNLTTLAVPLGRWTPRRLESVDLLDALVAFESDLSRLLVLHNGQPRRLIAARAALEARLMEFSAQREESPGSLLPVMLDASRLERELAITRGVVKLPAGERRLTRPLPGLDSRWRELVKAGAAQPSLCFDIEHPREFRLARAIASILPWGENAHDARLPAVSASRTNLLHLTGHSRSWKWDETSRAAVWSRGASLETNLAAILHRRLVDAQRGKGDGLPLWSFHGAEFTDVLALWKRELDEDRLGDLIHALALVDFDDASMKSITTHQVAKDPTPDLTPGGVWLDANGHEQLSKQPDYEGISVAEVEAAFALPRAYALLKLCFVGGRLPAVPMEKHLARRTGNEPFLNSPLRILNLLLAGRGPEALETAARFLRIKCCAPLMRLNRAGGERATSREDWFLSAEDCRRLAGLLLIPVHRPGVLAAISLKPKPN